MLQADGAIVLFYDADLATPPSEIAKVIAPIGENRYDVVFGSPDFPKFFSQVELGRSVGGQDGFVLLQRSQENERFLHSISAGSGSAQAETKR